MLMFTLAISCHLHFQFTLISTCHLLSSPLLIYLMGLTFQVPMQYCSLQQQTLLPPPETSTTGLCFHFGLDSSFFLDRFLCSSSVAHWAPTNLGNSCFSVIYFCLFLLFMGFSRQKCWGGLPFPSLVDHILSCYTGIYSILHIRLRVVCPGITQLLKVYDRTQAQL